MRTLTLALLLLAGCCPVEPSRDVTHPGSKLQVHYIVGGGLLVTGTDYHVIILEDGTMLVEVKNRIED